MIMLGRPGLAVALHSVASTTSLDLALERCLNFLGDADTTGAITGQLAGAIYGIGGARLRAKNDRFGTKGDGFCTENDEFWH